MRASSRSELSALVPLPPSAAADAACEPLAGKPPLERIVRSLLGGLAEQSDVVVSAAERLVATVRGLLADVGLASVRTVSVSGPAARTQCLAVGLELLSAQGARQVLVSDVRQPLIPDDVRDRVIAGLTRGDPVVLPTFAVTDSVKAVDEQGAVLTTLDRSTLQVVQYPRGFAVDHLVPLLASAGEGFDEADAALRAGLPVTMVDGDAEAFLADLPRDAPFVEAVIASRRR